MKKMTARDQIGIPRDPITGERDLSAESAELLKLQGRQNRNLLLIAAFMVAFIGFIWLFHHPHNACEGTRTVVARSGDSISSILDREVPGYKQLGSVDRVNALDDAVATNRSVIRPGDDVTIYTRCSR